MILGNKNQKPLLDPMIPIFIFVAGLSICVIYRLLNIYFLASTDVDYINYMYCKRYTGLSYLEWSGFILIGYCFLGILLIPGRNKNISIALIISCLSIAFNTALLRAAARVAHAGFIKSLEKEILSPDTDPYHQVWSKKRYLIALNNWRATEGRDVHPLPCAYWSASEKAEFKATNHIGWINIGPLSNNAAPQKIFFSDEGKAAGIFPDGTLLFGFASSEAVNTNDQKWICFNLATDTLDYAFYASRDHGILDTRYEIWSGASWEAGAMQYRLIHSAPFDR